MLKFKRLERHEANQCKELTFPSYRHLLDMQPCYRHTDVEDRLIQPMVVAAFDDTKVVGLAVLELPIEKAEKEKPELLSLFVLEGERNRGVGTALLGNVEEEVRRSGWDAMVIVYMIGSDRKQGIVALENLLEKQGWDSPVTRMVSVRFTIKSLQPAPWLNKYKLRSGYELFPWTDITQTEKQNLWKSQQESPWIPNNLVPWKHDHNGFEPVSSVGIRYRGEIVGWVINHRMNEDSVRFTCSFIRDDLARLARILPAYTASYNELNKIGVKNCSFTTPLQHIGMAAFAKKWFGPWSTYLGETRGSSKTLLELIANVG